MNITTAKRFTIDEYHRLADLGFFNEDDRIELIRGEIIQMAAKGTLHTTCCSNLIRELAKLVANQAELRCQDPIILPSNSEPEPDFTIVRQRTDNYISAHPKPDDILLLIEIADSTLKYDREVKLILYAEAGISDYWLFNLVENHLEAYSKPFQELNGTFSYKFKQIVLPNEVITLPNFSNLSLDLLKVFPRITDD